MRVTTDLDDPTRFDIVQSWHRLENISERIEGRISSSGNGIHMRGFGVETDDGLAERYRRICGDDPFRIYLDKKMYWRPSQVLYDEKDGKRSGSWVDTLTELLARYQIENPFLIS